MAQFIELPHVGESVVEGTIGKWLKQPGDRVERYDPLVEVVTDKVTMEVPSPVAGQLLRIVAQEGETVPMGAPIAEVEADGGAAATIEPTEAATATITPTPLSPSPSAAPAPQTASATPMSYLITDARPVGPTGGSAVEALAQEAADETPTSGQLSGSPVAKPATAAPPQPVILAPQTEVDTERPAHRLSPAVRRLAREHNVDVTRIAGTGMGGRVTRNDVLRYLETAPVTIAPPADASGAVDVVSADPTDDEERITITPVRRMIAEAMVRSVSQIPHAWSMVEADINELVALRNRERDKFRQRERINLTFLPFALKAVAGALKDNPTLNATWGQDHILLKRRINLGIAVAAPTGLVVPVIHDADRLSIAGLAHAIDDLAGRARAGSLRLEDVQGGTFTVNNTGALGSTVSGPIINHPQAGILTTEAVQQRAVVINDAIAIRWMMNLCLSFDHRINDGEETGAFLQSVKRRLEAMDGDTPIY